MPEAWPTKQDSISPIASEEQCQELVERWELQKGKTLGLLAVRKEKLGWCSQASQCSDLDGQCPLLTAVKNRQLSSGSPFFSRAHTA